MVQPGCSAVNVPGLHCRVQCLAEDSKPAAAVDNLPCCCVTAMMLSMTVLQISFVGTPLTHERFLRRNRGSYGPAIKAGEAMFPGKAADHCLSNQVAATQRMQDPTGDFDWKDAV